MEPAVRTPEYKALVLIENCRRAAQRQMLPMEDSTDLSAETLLRYHKFVLEELQAGQAKIMSLSRKAYEAAVNLHEEALVRNAAKILKR